MKSNDVALGFVVHSSLRFSLYRFDFKKAVAFVIYLDDVCHITLNRGVGVVPHPCFRESSQFGDLLKLV